MPQRCAGGSSEEIGCLSECPSKDLFDQVNRPVSTNLPSSDGEQPVQEGVFRFGSLETRHRSKVGSSWRSVVPDALKRHVDERAVVGLERDAEVELGDAVRAFDCPVVAAWEHIAAKPFTFPRGSEHRQRDTGSQGPE